MKGLSPKLPLSTDDIDGYTLIKSYNELVTQNLKNLRMGHFSGNKLTIIPTCLERVFTFSKNSLADRFQLEPTRN